MVGVGNSSVGNLSTDSQFHTSVIYIFGLKIKYIEF